MEIEPHVSPLRGAALEAGRRRTCRGNAIEAILAPRTRCVGGDSGSITDTGLDLQRTTFRRATPSPTKEALRGGAAAVGAARHVSPLAGTTPIAFGTAMLGNVLESTSVVIGGAGGQRKCPRDGAVWSSEEGESVRLSEASGPTTDAFGALGSPGLSPACSSSVVNAMPSNERRSDSRTKLMPMKPYDRAAAGTSSSSSNGRPERNRSRT